MARAQGEDEKNSSSVFSILGEYAKRARDLGGVNVDVAVGCVSFYRDLYCSALEARCLCLFVGSLIHAVV